MKTIAYWIILTFTLIACKKEHSQDASGTSNATSSLPLSDTALINDTTIFFDIEIDGLRELQIQPLNNYGVYWEGIVPYTSGSGFGLFIQGITNNINRGIEITRGNIYVDPGDTTIQLEKLRMVAGFYTGPYAYTMDPDSHTGVQIKWQDARGKTWSTSAGTGDQSNSNFQITDRVIGYYPPTGIIHGVHIRCTFNCILYDGAGNSIQMTNGKVGISVWL